MKQALAGLLMSILAITGAFAADTYPSQPVTMVIPGPAGGAIDNVARVIAQQMSVELNGNVVVLNLDGAGGTIATARVAHATPDGYTLLFHHIGVATAPALYKRLSYDTLKDLAPVGLTSEVPLVLVARNDFPPKSVQELIPYLKQQGEKIMLATAGVGNVSDLCGSLLMRQLGDKFTKVPYRGSPQALIDMIGGRVDMICDQTSTSAAQVESKAVKSYGVASKERLPILPDVPTLTAEGLPFVFSIWQGLYAPANTPPAVIAKLSQVLQAVVQSKSVQEKLGLIGVSMVDPSRATPQSHRAFLEEEMKRWANVYSDTPKM